MSYDKIQLVDFKFEERPKIAERSTSKLYSKKQNKEIAKYPFILMQAVSFKLDFKYIDDLEIEHKVTIRDTIPAGYVYNMADIPFMLQLVTYDKHSPYVRNASLIHDYLLQYKYEFFVKKWQIIYMGLTHKEARILTSDIFQHVLEQSGVPTSKAKFMRDSVDIYQKLFVWDWFKLEK